MNLFFSEKNSSLLNSGLSESAFGRSATGINFSEKGKIVRFSLFENNFTFDDFSFDGTTISSVTNTVCFEKENFTGTSALSIIKDFDEAKKARLTFALCKTISKSIDLKSAKQKKEKNFVNTTENNSNENNSNENENYENKFSLPNVGLGGIIYNEKISKKNPNNYLIELCFLPESLFEFCASSQDEKNYSNLQGFWQNKSLTGNNAGLFLQCSLIYFMLAQILPFNKTNLQERQEDIIDSNFIQIENLVNGINNNLAANVNFGLRLDNQFEREKSFIELDILKSELGLNDDGSFTKPVRQKILSDEDFKNETLKKEKSKKRKTLQKRFFKRNMISIIVGIVAIFIIANILHKSYLDNLEKPTAKNLTSRQAVETFFSGFHQQKTSLMNLVAKGTEPKKIVDMVSSIYVSSQTRTAFEGHSTTISPELFMTRPELMDYWIFGITNFSIDENSAHNRYSPISKREFKNIQKENLQNHFTQNQKETHSARYDFIYSTGYPNDILVDNCTATVECTYLGDQWYVTDVKIEHNENKVLQDDFRKNFTEVFYDTQSPKEIVKILKEKYGYNWLPDERAMDDGKKEAEYQKNFFK